MLDTLLPLNYNVREVKKTTQKKEVFYEKVNY